MVQTLSNEIKTKDNMEHTLFLFGCVPPSVVLLSYVLVGHTGWSRDSYRAEEA